MIALTRTEILTRVGDHAIFGDGNRFETNITRRGRTLAKSRGQRLVDRRTRARRRRWAMCSRRSVDPVAGRRVLSARESGRASTCRVAHVGRGFEYARGFVFRPDWVFGGRTAYPDLQLRSARRCWPAVRGRIPYTPARCGPMHQMTTRLGGHPVSCKPRARAALMF